MTRAPEPHEAKTREIPRPRLERKPLPPRWSRDDEGAAQFGYAAAFCLEGATEAGVMVCHDGKIGPIAIVSSDSFAMRHDDAEQAARDLVDLLAWIRHERAVRLQELAE